MCFLVSVGSLLNTEGVNKEPYISEDFHNERKDLICCSKVSCGNATCHCLNDAINDYLREKIKVLSCLQGLQGKPLMGMAKNVAWRLADHRSSAFWQQLKSKGIVQLPNYNAKPNMCNSCNQNTLIEQSTHDIKMCEKVEK